MLGQNAVEKRHPFSDGYQVHSIWYTLQGEGPLAGLPAVFVRFAGCHLKCYWCDTIFEDGTWHDLHALVHNIMVVADKNRCRRVVLTGGEPMLYALPELIMELRQCVGTIQIETAGTIWPTGMDDVMSRANVMIVCSPKTPHVHPKIEENTEAWKYIIQEGKLYIPDGLPIGSTQFGVDKPTQLIYRADVLPDHIYVQPCDEDNEHKNAANLAAATNSALKHGYRLCVQIHKLAGLP